MFLIYPPTIKAVRNLGLGSLDTPQWIRNPSFLELHAAQRKKISTKEIGLPPTQSSKPASPIAASSITVEYCFMCEVDGERAPDLLLTLTFDLQIIPTSIDTQSLNVRILPPFIIPKSGSKTKPPLDTREITSLSWELDVESLLNGGITIDFISPLPAKARLSFIDYTVFYASSRPTPCPGTMLSCEYLTLLLRAAQTSNLEPCVDELMPTVICNHQLFGQSIWTTLSPNGSTLHENTSDLEEVIKDLCLVEDFYTNPFLVIPSPGTEEIPQEWKVRDRREGTLTHRN
jgi:hypothetical protein